MKDTISTKKWLEMSNLGKEVNDLVAKKCKEPGNRVFVCDNNFVDRDLVSGIVKSADYRVVTGGSGREFIDILKANDIGLVITDLELLDMGALEMVSIMANHHVPMFVVTSLSKNDPNVVEAKLKGFTVLTKPVNPKELLSNVVIHFGPAYGSKSESQRNNKTKVNQEGAHHGRH